MVEAGLACARPWVLSPEPKIFCHSLEWTNLEAYVSVGIFYRKIKSLTYQAKYKKNDQLKALKSSWLGRVTGFPENLGIYQSLLKRKL